MEENNNLDLDNEIMDQNPNDQVGNRPIGANPDGGPAENPGMGDQGAGNPVDMENPVAMAENMLGLPAGTVMGMLSSDEETRTNSINAVVGVLTNVNTVINSLRPGIENSSATVIDLVGGLLSTVLGRLGETIDADNNPIPFPDIIDGSTGLTRILGEIGKFLKNFDLFAESITGEVRDNEMAKLFVRNLDNLMGGALSFLNIMGEPQE